MRWASITHHMWWNVCVWTPQLGVVHLHWSITSAQSCRQWIHINGWVSTEFRKPRFWYVRVLMYPRCRLKSWESGLHGWSAWFGGMLDLLLSPRSHLHIHIVINKYSDCVSLCVPLIHQCYEYACVVGRGGIARVSEMRLIVWFAWLECLVRMNVVCSWVGNQIFTSAKLKFRRAIMCTRIALKFNPCLMYLLNVRVF